MRSCTSKYELIIPACGYTDNIYSIGAPMNVADKFEKLNAAQRAAACHGDGALLILAGAGTGKTNTLAHRVAHLVLQGANPQRTLLLTFSRRAGRAARHARRAFPLVRGVGGGADPALSHLCRTQAREPGARLRRSPPLLERDARRRAPRARHRRGVRPHSGGRIPGHERPEGAD